MLSPILAFNDRSGFTREPIELLIFNDQTLQAIKSPEAQRCN